MASLIAQNLAPIMFAALVAFLLLGYPVAFSLGAVGLLFFAVGVELAPYSKCLELSSVCKRIGDPVITLDWPLLQSLPASIFGIMSNDTLLAIPFFTFMGLVLERSGMAEDLLDTVGQLFGTVRGGLAYAVIFVGALLAATTGVVAASVISMGLISLPIMLRYGYDRRLASGVIAASGTLAQIIPPSLVLIVMADQLGKSVGDMYEAAFLPGMMLAGLYAGYVFLVATLWPEAAPGLPPEAIGFREDDGSRGLGSLAVLAFASGFAGWMMLRGSAYKSADLVILTLAASIAVAFAVALASWAIRSATGVRVLSRLAEQVTFVMVPPLALIFLVLGTMIFIGLATPTEGGAMGAAGAMVLALAKRMLDGDRKRFSFEIVRQAAEATAKLSAFVMFILIGARIFSLAFYGVNGHLWIEHLLTGLPGGQLGFLIFVNLMVFVLAFFLDFFELAFIIVPLLAPVAQKLDIDLIWFGVMLSVNMQTSFMHPPFGFALFYLRSVAAKEPYLDRVTGKLTDPVTTGQIYWGAVPFVVIQMVMVGALIAFPSLVLPDKAPARPAQGIPSSTPGVAPGSIVPQGSIELPKLGLPPGLSLGGPSLGGPSLGGAPRIEAPARPPADGPSLPQTSPFAGPAAGGPSLPRAAPRI